MEILDFFLVKNGVKLGVCAIGSYRFTSNSLPSDGEWMRILARSGVLFRRLLGAQTSLDVIGEQVFERDALLNSAGFYFLKKRVG